MANSEYDKQEDKERKKLIESLRHYQSADYDLYVPKSAAKGAIDETTKLKKRVRELDEKCKTLDGAREKAEEQAKKYYDASIWEMTIMTMGLKLIERGVCDRIGSMLCGQESCDCAMRFAAAWIGLLEAERTVSAPEGIDQEAWTEAGKLFEEYEKEFGEAENRYGDDDPWDRGL